MAFCAVVFARIANKHSNELNNMYVYRLLKWLVAINTKTYRLIESIYYKNYMHHLVLIRSYGHLVFNIYFYKIIKRAYITVITYKSMGCDIPYIRNYWRSLNLAICLKSGRNALLADFKFGRLLR